MQITYLTQQAKGNFFRILIEYVARHISQELEEKSVIVLTFEMI